MEEYCECYGIKLYDLEVFFFTLKLTLVLVSVVVSSFLGRSDHEDVTSQGLHDRHSRYFFLSPT